MAAVFDTAARNVQMHVRSVYSSEELDAPATAKDFFVIRQEGDRRVKREVGRFNLDAIISVGYRVNPMADSAA